MAVINEQATWAEDIYLIDPNDPVQGGAGGIDNLPHEQLANRTAYLKQELEGLNIPDNSTDLEELNSKITDLEQADVTINERIDGLDIPDHSTDFKQLNDKVKDLEQADIDLNQRIDGLGTSDNSTDLEELNSKIAALEQADVTINNRIDGLGLTTVAGATVTVIFHQYDKYVGNGWETENLNNIIITGLNPSNIPYEIGDVKINGVGTGFHIYSFRLPDSVTDINQLIIHRHLASVTVDMATRVVVIAPHIKTYEAEQGERTGRRAMGNASVTIMS